MDTSFLVSLYRPDANSASAFRSVGRQRATLMTTAVGELEFLNALELLVFRNEISAAEARGCRDNFRSDLRDGVFQVAGFPEGLFDRAFLLSGQTTSTRGTRAMDLVHVAAALELRAEFLYSFDERQRELARKLRLKLNPV